MWVRTVLVVACMQCVSDGPPSAGPCCPSHCWPAPTTHPAHIIQPSLQLYVHTIHLSIFQVICLSVQSSILPFVHPSFRLSIHPSNHKFVLLFVCSCSSLVHSTMHSRMCLPLRISSKPNTFATSLHLLTSKIARVCCTANKHTMAQMFCKLCPIPGCEYPASYDTALLRKTNANAHRVSKTEWVA